MGLCSCGLVWVLCLVFPGHFVWCGGGLRVCLGLWWLGVVGGAFGFGLWCTEFCCFGLCGVVVCEWFLAVW